MTAVLSVTWQSFRLGLHGSPIGLAGLSTLRETLSSSSHSKKQFCSIHSLLNGSSLSSSKSCNIWPTTTPYRPSNRFSVQARCASLWKSKQEEEPPRQKAARSEALMPRAEINAIFGLRMDRKDGSDLLKCLQEHRQQGTLDQKLPYPDALIEKGLKYLRAKYPLDEDAAIIARIDREADRTFRLPQTNIDQSPQAVSQWEILRQENRKKHAEKVEAEEEKAREEMENPKTLAKESPKAARRVIVKDGTALVQLRPEPEWIQRYRDKAQMKELPEMSAWAKLVPSGLVTIAVVTLAVLFAQFYKQPSRKARLWPDLPPAAATLITLIGANIAVFVLWRLPPLWRTLNRFFLVVPAYPHSLSMLTACFSHQSFSHLLTNLIPLWLIGTRRMSTLILFTPYI